MTARLIFARDIVGVEADGLFWASRAPMGEKDGGVAQRPRRDDVVQLVRKGLRGCTNRRGAKRGYEGKSHRKGLRAVTGVTATCFLGDIGTPECDLCSLQGAYILNGSKQCKQEPPGTIAIKPLQSI